MDWRSLADELVDSRTLGRNDAELRATLHTGAYVQLSRSHFYPAERWRQTAPWLRDAVRAVAVGRSMHRGVVVGRSAGRLHGMWLVPSMLSQHEVALPSGKVPAARWRMEGVVYRSMSLCEGEVVDVEGLRVTGQVRTVLDIARFHGFRDGLLAADWALSQARVHPQRLQQAVAQMGRFRNVRVVRQVLAAAVSDADSALESLVRAEFLLRGIGGWRFQVLVGGRFRADFLFDDLLIVELDGQGKHGQDPGASLMRERQREYELTNRGFVFLRFTYRDVVEDMDGVVAQIMAARTALRARRG